MSLHTVPHPLLKPAISCSYISAWKSNENKADILKQCKIIFGCASYFLQKYVVTAETALVVGIVGSYVVFTSYFTFDYYLKQLSSSYKNIPEDKQFYVLSNLIKSAALFAYSPLAAQLLYETMYLDVWNSNKIRIMGTLYSIPDFVSLIVVKRMANTTKIHHVVVVVFNIISKT